MIQLLQSTYSLRSVKYIIALFLFFGATTSGTTSQFKASMAKNAPQEKTNQRVAKEEKNLQNEKEALDKEVFWIPYRYSRIEKAVAIFTGTLLVWTGYVVIGIRAWTAYLRDDYYPFIFLGLAAIANFIVFAQTVKVMAFKGDVLSTEQELIIPERLAKSYFSYSFIYYLQNKKIVIPYQDILVVRRKEITRWGINGRVKYDLIELICSRGESVEIYQLHGAYCQNTDLLEELLFRLFDKGIIVDMNG